MGWIGNSRHCGLRAARAGGGAGRGAPRPGSGRRRRPARWVVLAASLAAGALSPVGTGASEVSAPAATGSFPAVELVVGGAARGVDAAGYFSGTVSSYRAASSAVSVVSVSVSGSSVTLAPRAAGSATVTVTATNSAGSASQAFAVKVLPKGCLVSLGALAAGSVTTMAGSWSSAGGCVSVRRPFSRSSSYYARYYTFTVSEPVEAWFRLSSGEGKFLYLLAGAGTGGRRIAFEGTYSPTRTASEWEKLQPGAYTVEVAAARPGREAAFTLTVDSMALTPPASCFTQLGALKAGATVTRKGAWDRGDGCRSTNRTSSQQFRHYARYYTFTVAEALQARFELSSAEGKYLYLLASAGSGGRRIASAGTNRAAAGASLRRSLKPGTYTVEASTYYSSREADFTLTVAAAASAPTVAGAIATQELAAGASASVDLSAAFNGTVDTYTAASSDNTVVTASVKGTIVTLTGAAPGTAAVTVTAANAAGSAEQTIAVTVAQAPPAAAGALPAQALAAGTTAAVDVSSAFDGAVDTYTATSSDTTVVTATARGSQITLTGVAAGTATVTVTAANAAGGAQQTLAVTVEPAAPRPAGTLAAKTLTAGDSVDVDLAGAFTGAVDAYTATSNDAAVADISLAGSVLTLTGIAAGTAAVTVAAANTAGSAAQTMSVKVNLPPAPTLGAPLAAQTLQVTGTLAVDISAGFRGRIDSYTAASGDTNKLTAAADGSTVTLTGVAAGATTVTVTAANAAGRAARSFNVAVTPLAAPRTANTPTARSVAVGEQLPLHIADAFTGIVHTYTATSEDTSVVRTSVDGATVTLTGAAAGTATVTLAAANAAGTTTAALPVTVKAPEKLTVAVAAPSHCLGSEGALAPGGGRRGVGTIDVDYHVAGGAGPYTITSPDAPGTTRTEPTGTITVPCARRGVDLSSVTPDTNVVESGPRTITITAADNTGATATANIRIEVAEDAYTTEYNNGAMHPGKTYVLGTPDKWALITLPAGLTLRFEGLSDNNMAHFTEPTTGTQIVLDWTTGKEIRRHIPAPAAALRTAEQTTDRHTTAHPIKNRLDALAASALVPGETFTRNSVNGTAWRPYRGLPADTSVAIHPKLFNGRTLNVCIDESDITMKLGDGASGAMRTLTTTLAAAVSLWNSKTGRRSIGARLLQGLTHDVFEFDATNPACAGPDSGDVRVQLRTTVIQCGNTEGAAGCAHWEIAGDPPQITGKLVEIAASYAYSQRIVAHELGHFLGLGDYGYVCPTQSARRGVVAYRMKVSSLMAYEETGCGSETVESRDLEDLSSIYHPPARTGVEIRAHAGLGPPSYFIHTGDLARDFIGSQVEVAHKYAFFERELTSGSAWRFVRWYDLDSVNGLANQGGRIDIGYDPWSSVYELTDRPRTEYMLVGVAKGDHKRVEGLAQGVKYSVLRDGGDSWSLGTPAVAADPARPGSGTADSGGGSGGTGTSGGKGGPAAAVPGKPVCPQGDGFSWERRADGDGGWWCDRVEVADDAVVSTVLWRCPESAGDPRVLAGGAVECVREDPRALRSRPGRPRCEAGFKEVRPATPPGVVQACSKTESEPAAATTEYSCSAGWSLARFFVKPGVAGRRCEKTVPATTSRRYSCPAGYSLAAVPLGGQECRKSAPATARTTRSCSAGWSLVRFFVRPGVAGYRCEKSAPATASKAYSCPEGYSLARIPLGGQECRKSAPATARTTRSCSAGWSLVRFFVRPGVAGYRCEKSVPATARTTYSCPAGYSLVRIPLGGQYCRKTVPATAKHSCPSGYARSGATCFKYTYTSPTGTKCPAGYTLVYNGIFHRCRKRLATPATVTYSCSSGRLSGSNCVHTATPKSETTYSCASGRLSGSKCVSTAAPTTETTYSCSSGRLSGSKCVFTATPAAEMTYSCAAGRLSGTKCVHTATPKSETTYSCAAGRLSGSNCVITAPPTLQEVHSCAEGTLSGSFCVLTAPPASTVIYDCDDAPAGYTLRGQDCVKTITRAPAPTTIRYCAPGYELSAPGTCTQTSKATKTTVDGCRSVGHGEAPYALTSARTAAGTVNTCTRTITVAAETGAPTCPAPAENEAPYRLTVTAGSDGRTAYSCERPAETDEEDGE